MNVIMSFWSDPYIKKLHNKWVNENTWNLSWILSVEAATKAYGKPKLYTDDAGAKFLVDDLKLEFSDVDLCLNDLRGRDARFTTLGRTYAVGMQTKPFIHIDYDCFLFESIPTELFHNGLLFQKEVFIDTEDSKNGNSPFHRPDLFNNVKNLPKIWKQYIVNNKFKVYQTSIMGGSDTEFFQKYSETVFDILNSNTENTWTDIDKKSKETFVGKPFVSQGFTPQYTLDEYLPFILSKEAKKTPRYLINGYDISISKFSHVSFEKSKVGDLYGRIARRIMHSFPHRSDQIRNFVQNKSLSIPKVSVIIIPNEKSEAYDTVLRSIIPRKLSPDEIIVSGYHLSESSNGLISRLENVKIVPGGNSYIDSLRIAFKRTKGDLIIVIDGHVKTPKLYIEKCIAAYLEFQDSVFCCAGNDFQDEKILTSHGAVKDDYGTRPNMVPVLEDSVLNHSEVLSLFGGLYAFPSKALHAIFDLNKDMNSIEEISSRLSEHGFKLRCMKNLIVSHNGKLAIDMKA